MNRAELKDSIKLIDYEQLIGSLKTQEISIYGGATKCIDTELYEKIIGYLNGVGLKSKNCISPEERQPSGCFQDCGGQSDLSPSIVLHQALKCLFQEDAMTR